MKKKKKRAGVLLLILVLILTQIYLPGANIQVRANTPDVENAQEEVSASAEATKEDTKDAEKKDTKASGGDKPDTAAEKDSAGEKTEESQQDALKKTEEENIDTDNTESAAKPQKEATEEGKTDEIDSTVTAKETLAEIPVTLTTDSDPGTDSDNSNGEGSDSSNGTEPDSNTEQGENTDSGEDTQTGGGNDTDTGDVSEGGTDDNPTEPAFDKYRVTFQVTGENNAPLEDAEIYVQKSVDGENFDPQEAVSETENNKFELAAKQTDTYPVYKFTIKADCYLTGEGTFNFDPHRQEGNNYFDLAAVGQDFTINVHLNLDQNLYRVEFKAIDEKGDLIADPAVSLNWSVDIYGSYSQEAQSPGVYILKKKRSNGDWMYYTFSVAKEGYTFYEGTKFCFRTDWWNPYFDVKADQHFLTITVQLTSLTTALDNAKINALQELQNYKRLDDYRQAEQQKITSLIETWTSRINNATTVNSVGWNLEQAKIRLDKVKTNVEYEDEEYRSRIYFQTSDGQKNYVNQYGVVTVTNVDSGNFHITHPDGSLYENNEWDAKWRCVYEYEDLDHPGNTAFQVIVGTYGQFAGKFVGKYDATVTLSDLGRAVHFTVQVVSGQVTQLRASVDGKDVSGKTIKVMGSEKKKAVIEGKLGGSGRWISIPWHALKYTAGGSTSVMPATEEFRTWGTSGSMTYTLDADRSVSVSFNIEATIVKPTGVKVICPSKATVGDWNGAFNQYVGIMEGQDGYRVEVTPSNASNPGVTWEDLTPDVATFQSRHALGIVPKKAGTAKFRVTCVDNPKASTTVTILFQYEKPLKTAEAEKSVYYAKTSDKTIDLKIITNGKADSSKGASEQRFTWSYSTSGVVKVSDGVHYDKTSVTIPNWFSHTISILGEGTVYVTGTPYDMTENCKPVKFKVVVSDTENLDKAEAERVEKLILAIGKVTLEKKHKIQNARAEFKALTATQKGLVDDDIYDILVKAELELRRLERAEADENGGEVAVPGTDEGTNNGGTDTPAQGGTEESSQEGENAGTSGDEPDTPGAAGGTDIEETEGTGDTVDSEEEIESVDNTTETTQEKKTPHTAVTAAESAEQNIDAQAPQQPGKKGTGKKFFEVDINEMQQEIEQILDEISPATKAAVVVGASAAFVFGFIWRRRQYLRDKKKK